MLTSPPSPILTGPPLKSKEEVVDLSGDPEEETLRV